MLKQHFTLRDRLTAEELVTLVSAVFPDRDARPIAVYLAHVHLSWPQRRLIKPFRVGFPATKKWIESIEDERDNSLFDAALCDLEARLPNTVDGLMEMRRRRVHVRCNLRWQRDNRETRNAQQQRWRKRCREQQGSIAA